MHLKRRKNMKQMNRVTLVGRLMKDIQKGTTTVNHKEMAYGTLIIDSGKMDSEKKWHENVNAIDVRAYWDVEEFAKGKKGDMIFIDGEINSYLQVKDELNPAEKYMVVFVKVLNYGPWVKPKGKKSSEVERNLNSQPTPPKEESMDEKIKESKVALTNALETLKTAATEESLANYTKAKENYETLCAKKTSKTKKNFDELLNIAEKKLLDNPSKDNLAKYNELKAIFNSEQKKDTSNKHEKTEAVQSIDKPVTDSKIEKDDIAKVGNIVDPEMEKKIKEAFNQEGEVK